MCALFTWGSDSRIGKKADLWRKCDALGNDPLGNLAFMWMLLCTTYLDCSRIMHSVKLQQLFRRGLRNMVELKLLPWPPSSPDVNSIEHL